jgi:hypothetical protein
MLNNPKHISHQTTTIPTTTQPHHNPLTHKIATPTPTPIIPLHKHHQPPQTVQHKNNPTLIPTPIKNKHNSPTINTIQQPIVRVQEKHEQI